MKALALLSVFLILMGCIVREEASQEKSVAGKLGKSIKVLNLADELAPKMKRLIMAGDNASHKELARLISKGGVEGEAAARAFRHTLQKPLDEYVELIENIVKKHGDEALSKDSPLAKKTLQQAEELVRKKTKEGVEITNRYREALEYLDANFIGVRALKIKKNPLRMRAWVERNAVTLVIGAVGSVIGGQVLLLSYALDSLIYGKKQKR